MHARLFFELSNVRSRLEQFDNLAAGKDELMEWFLRLMFVLADSPVAQAHHPHSNVPAVYKGIAEMP